MFQTRLFLFQFYNLERSRTMSLIFNNGFYHVSLSEYVEQFTVKYFHACNSCKLINTQLSCILKINHSHFYCCCYCCCCCCCCFCWCCCWAEKIKQILDEIGMTELWLSQNTTNISIHHIKQRTIDIYHKTWKTSSRNHRIPNYLLSHRF